MTLQQWLDQWKHKSPEVQGRVHVALDFLQKHYGAKNEKKILDEIRCIDFSRPVELPAIPARTILVGSKDARVSPYRAVYFTKSGHPVERLGISPQGALKTSPKVLDKVLNRYEVLVPIPSGEALQSTCAPAADTWSVEGRKVLAGGGGLQYLIPKMNRYLRYIP
jgi:Bacterial toxin 46